MLRTLLGLAKSNTYENILHYAHLKSLTHRRHFQSLILLFKCVKGQGPIYLKDFFKVRLAQYNLRGSGSKLEQPSFNSTWGKNSFCSITSRLWNHLPDTACNADNIKHFIKILNETDLDMDIYLA